MANLLVVLLLRQFSIGDLVCCKGSRQTDVSLTDPKGQFYQVGHQPPQILNIKIIACPEAEEAHKDH